MRTGGHTLRMYGHSFTGVLGLSQDLRRAGILRRMEEHKKNKENAGRGGRPRKKRDF